MGLLAMDVNIESDRIWGIIRNVEFVPDIALLLVVPSDRSNCFLDFAERPQRTRIVSVKLNITSTLVLYNIAAYLCKHTLQCRWYSTVGGTSSNRHLWYLNKLICRVFL